MSTHDPVFYDSLTVEGDPLGNHRVTITAGGDVAIWTASSNPASGPGWSANRSDGTLASPSAVGNGYALDYPAYVQAHDGTDFVQVGQMLFSVSGTVSTGIVPTRFGLSVMDDTGALWEPLVVESTRDVLPDGIWKDMVLNGPFIDGDWNAWGGLLNYPTLAAPRENVTISGTGATGTIHLETLDRTSKFITANSTSDFTINMRGNSSWTLDQTMQTGDLVEFRLYAPMGTTAYYASSIAVDGVAATVKWPGGSAPVAGIPSALNIYDFQVIKTAAATFTIIGQFGAVS